MNDCKTFLVGGAVERKSITYALAPDHFSGDDTELFRESEAAYEDAGFSLRMSKNPDVIVHLSTDKQLKEMYPQLKQYPSKLSLTDRGVDPMRIYLHLENWLSIPHGQGSEYTSLRDYRQALINHEFVHAFGHDHVSCPCKGCLSDVRQQPSRHLGGCLPTTKIVFHKKAKYSSVNF
jgi:hypothetical protein